MHSYEKNNTTKFIEHAALTFNAQHLHMNTQWRGIKVELAAVVTVEEARPGVIVSSHHRIARISDRFAQRFTRRNEFVDADGRVSETQKVSQLVIRVAFGGIEQRRPEIQVVVDVFVTGMIQHVWQT